MRKISLSSSSGSIGAGLGDGGMVGGGGEGFGLRKSLRLWALPLCVRGERRHGFLCGPEWQ